MIGKQIFVLFIFELLTDLNPVLILQVYDRIANLY